MIKTHSLYLRSSCHLDVTLLGPQLILFTTKYMVTQPERAARLSVKGKRPWLQRGFLSYIYAFPLQVLAMYNKVYYIRLLNRHIPKLFSFWIIKKKKKKWPATYQSEMRLVARLTVQCLIAVCRTRDLLHWVFKLVKVKFDSPLLSNVKKSSSNLYKTFFTLKLLHKLEFSLKSFCI